VTEILIPQTYVTLGGKTKLFEGKSKLKGPPRFALNSVHMAREWRDSTARGDSYAVVGVKKV
jgi:hypothetical protein